MHSLTRLQTTGPLPVASYIRQVLTSDLGGYYTATASSKRDQFGTKGDFVTSPEISQIFGELIGIWFVAEWITQGRKSEGVYLMEMGPGRGTLMDDMLRVCNLVKKFSICLSSRLIALQTIRNFSPFAKAIEAVYLVEVSESLRKAQHQLLCGDNALKENDIGHESVSRHSNDLKVVWVEDLRLIPREADKTPFIVAHEFFDALPIHVFQSTGPLLQQDQTKNIIQTPTGPIETQQRNPPQTPWREMLVSPKPPHRLKDGEPEFELSLSKTSTPHAMYLPEVSPRYQALKDTDGATIEISPESQSYVRDFAIRLGGSNPPPSTGPSPSAVPGRVVSPTSREEPVMKPEPSGAALIIDYGPPATIPANSLRGIRSHTRVSPFDSPGAVDVSADVDFMALAESAINSSPGVEVHGPVDQARFLTAMGIEERAAQLVKRAVNKERDGSTGQDKGELTELAKRVESGWKRLVDRGPQGMGRLYQVMAILPFSPPKEGEPRRRPVGFGGDISL